MNNQAAQTMPEPVTASMCPSSDYARGWNDCLAALSQTAGVPDGWKLVPVIPTKEMIARGDEIIAEDGKRVRPESIYDAMVSAAPAASGGDRPEPDARCNCGWGDTKDHLREECTPIEAAASVSERARELLAAEYEAAGYVGVAAHLRSGEVETCIALRALEQALTQQRGESTQAPPAMGEADDREPEDWRIGWALAYTGWALYTDDGELQDNREAPFIDFRRDDAALIRKKIAQRAKNHGRYIESATHDGVTNPKPKAAAGGASEPYDECYSLDGDSWVDSPADTIFVDGLSVGDTYKVVVSHYSIERTYVVTKAPDETSDDYEVRPIEPTTPQPSADAVRELVQQWENEAVKCDAEAERPGCQSIKMELHRDAAQYRQCAYQLRTKLESLLGRGG